jgi:hypothetical protein
MIPASEREKTVHALDGVATVMGEGMFNIHDILPTANIKKNNKNINKVTDISLNKLSFQRATSRLVIQSM